MIRVTFAEREPEDVPANRATTSADGSLVLEWMDLGEVVNPQTLQRQTVVTALAWIRTYSRATGWLTAEPTLVESAEGPERAGAEDFEGAVGTEPAIEPESAETGEREPEEAIR